MAGNGFDEWGGYMDAKITKLEEQFAAASDPFRQSNLFAGISIFVNGLTNPSADELKRIMMVHGGTFHHYERKHTTYIIASNLPDVKVRNMDTSKIISAQWVVDCLKEKRILDYTRYLLYTNQKTTQPRLTFTKSEKSLAETNTAASINNITAKNVDSSMNESTANTGTKPATSTNTSSVARTAVDPKFLSEFYNNSRLHHIATLGAGFKQYVNELREKHGEAAFPARLLLKEKLKAQGLLMNNWNNATGYVMHIDMDCFFVSVGLRKYPHLRGQPVAVTHSKGGAAAATVPVHPGANRQVEQELFTKRFEQNMPDSFHTNIKVHGFNGNMSLSEIASCSYEARAKGLRNGMFVGHAIKLCPELKTIPYDFEGYREVAFTLYDTIAQYTLDIEAVSCDEMFVDLTDVLKELQVSPLDFVRCIRAEVREKTSCPCSAGVGANKLQARMATKHAKPDGQYMLEPSSVETYMAPIPIEDLPGVGSSTAYNLKEAGLVTCGDLQKCSLTKIQMHVGKKFGETLYKFCRGMDDRALAFGQIRKSVSAEVNYGIRFKENDELEKFLRQLCTEVHTRLMDIKRKTKCITLKLMVRAKEAPVETSKFMGHGVCDHITKSVSLTEFTNDLELITRTILTTMRAMALPPNELRGIGIQLSKLDESNESKDKKKENVIKNMFSKVVEKQKENKSDMNGSRNVETVGRTSTVDIKKPVDTKLSLKRSRGRPPGGGVGANIPKDGKKSSNASVVGMLQNAVAKKECKIPNTVEALPADVDPEVFAALPADIRAEILQEAARKEQQSKKETIKNINNIDTRPSTSKSAASKKQLSKNQTTQHENGNANQQHLYTVHVDEEFLKALPNALRKEIELQIKQQQPKLPSEAANVEFKEPGISSTNIFAQSNCIELLLAWVKSGDRPENYDIDLISSNAREFVRTKKISELYDPLLYLCRLINQQKMKQNDCAWHVAFRVIFDAVQLEMCEVYNGRMLYLRDRIKCDKCINYN